LASQKKRLDKLVLPADKGMEKNRGNGLLRTTTIAIPLVRRPERPFSTVAEFTFGVGIASGWLVNRALYFCVVLSHLEKEEEERGKRRRRRENPLPAKLRRNFPRHFSRRSERKLSKKNFAS